MKQQKKTNAMRHLDDKGLSYTPHYFELKDAVDGMEVAKMLNEDPDCVFKTLVTVTPDREHFVFMVPVNGHLSLKKAAKAAGVKHVEMLPLKQLLPTTGYVHGGCSPLGMKKEFPVFIDETALLSPTIYFSGGKIGVQIEIEPEAFIQTFQVQTADLTEE